VWHDTLYGSLCQDAAAAGAIGFIHRDIGMRNKANNCCNKPIKVPVKSIFCHFFNLQI
jgi:hypothetical protein